MSLRLPLENDHGANTSVRASSGLGRGLDLGEVDGGLDGSGDFLVGLL